MAITLDRCVADKALAVARERMTDGEDSVLEVTAPPADLNARFIDSTRFGRLEVEEDIVITFPEGVIGFETCRRFVVVRHEENSAFRWIQSLEVPSLAFPVIEPNQVRPDYAPTISDADARALDMFSDSDALLFTIVTVPPLDPRKMTVNLLAPLVVNALTRQGRQVIVQDEEYTTRHSVVEELERTALRGNNPAVALKPNR